MADCPKERNNAMRRYCSPSIIHTAGTKPKRIESIGGRVPIPAFRRERSSHGFTRRLAGAGTQPEFEENHVGSRNAEG